MAEIGKNWVDEYKFMGNKYVKPFWDQNIKLFMIRGAHKENKKRK